MPFEPHAIKGIRGMLNMPQDSFAARIGVSKTTVCNWETGVSQPRVAHVDQIYGLCEEHGIRDAPLVYKPPNREFFGL